VTEDLKFRRSDGSTFWCRVRGMAVNKAEPLKGAAWIYEDVTDKRRSEEAMRLALSVMEHTVDAIFVADPELRVLRVNPAFARILG
jgi:PAS domain-containing protein